jgi:hypothetical protein
VWKSGKEFDLGRYVAFCARHAWVDYYVNLDVIPGAYRDRRSLTPAAVEESCRKGWDNYRRMARSLPQGKLVPVFHQGDHPRWLDRYLSAGCRYVGVSPAGDRGDADRRKWVKSLRPLLFDGAGRPVAKTHGFGVSSPGLLGATEWGSVDSATWKQMASWGIILLPEEGPSGLDYSRPWFALFVSEATPNRSRRNEHLESANPILRERLARCLDRYKMSLGRSEIVRVGPDYRLRYRRAQGVEPGEGESWYDKSKGLVLRPLEPGVTNSFRERCKFNVHFHKGQQRRCPVGEFYLAGSPTPYSWETKMGYRLLSYDVVGSPSGERKLLKHRGE